MQTMIQQWGNSLALRIPKAFAQQAKVKKGSRVRFTVEKNRLVVEPVAKTKITLASLLAGVTPENIHPETDWGKPMGREIW
jgi:antitoxin MazE